ncbi:MAG: AAA family ATPase [Candidatus Pacearchaeota archaeon]
MVRTIGLIAIKGGVGKTTLSASLAADLANRLGKKVLLVDANYSAPNLGLHMDIIEPVKTIHDVLAGKAQMLSAIHKRYGVDVIPGSYFYEKGLNPLKLKSRIDLIKKDYDFVIIDSSPSLNDELLSAMIASDNLFVITTPDYPTLSCSLRAAKTAKQKGKPVTGIIINKIREPKYELHLEEIEKALEIPVVAKIPDDKTNVKALFTRIPVTLFNPKSPFAKEIARFSDALAGNQEKVSWLKKLFSSMLGKEQINRQLMRDKFYKSIFSQKSEKK